MRLSSIEGLGLGSTIENASGWFSKVSYLNAVSLIGFFAMLGLAWLMSSEKRRVNWRLVASGVLMQLVVAMALFQSQHWTWYGQFPNGILYDSIDSFFQAIDGWSKEGARFVFEVRPGEDESTGPVILLTSFAFGVIPTVIFFSSLMSVLYYFGIMQVVVRGMAWSMQRLLGTSGAESLAAAANVFVGHTEAPLVVKPYVAKMTRSEMNAMMVGGFATITGGLLALFVMFGISAGHLAVASIISAPAALVIAKILQPETEEPLTRGSVKLVAPDSASNVVEAAANGAGDGLRLAMNIIGMLIAFVALVAMFDSILFWIGNGIEAVLNAFVMSAESQVDFSWSLASLFGLVFWPLAWIMGIETRDCFVSGNLLGLKMVVTEVQAYQALGEIAQGASATNATLSPRSQLILTYALCGFTNFGAIGIQLGGIGGLAPERRSEIAQLGMRAMLGGMLACCCTACLAGMFYGILISP